MRASDLFNKIEDKIPLSLALEGDQVGYIGTQNPDSFDVKHVLVLLDYLPSCDGILNNTPMYDLLILHHPPVKLPPVPTYVIHSNWDIISGGACDALAESLDITPYEILDEETGIGRIGKINPGPVSLSRFVHEIMVNLRIHDIRLVNGKKLEKIEKVCLVSGFGLQPDLIKKAIMKDVDVFISGDLTHAGAMIAKHAGITLIDATHYATEFPGLCKLGNFIASLGLSVDVKDVSIPWIVTSINT